MQKKFSIIINHRKDGYVAVLRSWQVGENGQQSVVDTKTYTNIETVEEALKKAENFVTKHSFE